MKAEIESEAQPGQEPPTQEAPDEEPPIEEAPVALLDGLSWQILVSSYYMFNAHRVAGPYNDLEYPYADTQGFGLVFVGGDVSFRTEKFGIRLDLRWGQNVDRLTEFTPVSRGYVTWIPGRKLTLDFGYFGAFVGIESADEWENATFTRGVIYLRMQPFRHLGARATIAAHDKFDVVVIVANGSIFGRAFPSGLGDPVVVPAVGGQLVYRPVDDVGLSLGSVASPNGSNGNRDWQAIVDLIATWEPGAWNVFINLDYQFSRQGPLTGLTVNRQWGVSFGGSYQINDHWSAGFRGEYFANDADTAPRTVLTATGNVRYSPLEYLIFSLEPRAEFSDGAIFFSRPFVTDPVTGETTPSLNKDWFFGFWLGVTARIGN